METRDPFSEFETSESEEGTSHSREHYYRGLRIPQYFYFTQPRSFHGSRPGPCSLSGYLLLIHVLVPEIRGPGDRFSRCTTPVHRTPRISDTLGIRTRRLKERRSLGSFINVFLCGKQSRLHGQKPHRLLT